MKAWLEKRGIYWHGSRSARDGFRGWLNMGKHSFHLQICRHCGSYGGAIQWGGQETLIAGHVLAGVGMFWSWSPPFSWLRHVPKTGQYHEIAREIALTWHDEILWWRFLCPTMGSSRDRFRHEFHVGNWFLGRPRYTCQVLEENIPVSITIDQWDGDGPYTGKARREHCEWKRRFSTKRVDDFVVDMDPPGLPFPGKGENSWDCGDDAIYGFGGVSLEAAIAKNVADVKRYRQRYGGSNWRPTDDAEKATA